MFFSNIVYFKYFQILYALVICFNRFRETLYSALGYSPYIFRTPHPFHLVNITVQPAIISFSQDHLWERHFKQGL